jgi:hypothetical protein
MALENIQPPIQYTTPINKGYRITDYNHIIIIIIGLIIIKTKTYSSYI